MIANPYEKYAVVIMPPLSEIEYVRKLKEELNAAIGWYHSKNAEAHISILEFQATETEIIKIIHHLRKVASYEREMHLAFDGVGQYLNGAVFLKPTDTCKAPLVAVMKRVQEYLHNNIKLTGKSNDPHLSIGRQLNDEQKAVALSMFADASLNFKCSGFTLRKFDRSKRQYQVHTSDLVFSAAPRKPPAQQSLF